MIVNFTVIGSTSNTQPIANKYEKFLLKSKTRLDGKARFVIY